MEPNWNFQVFSNCDWKQQITKYCTVIRNNKEIKLLHSEIVVGDLIVLKTGMKIPCDGIFISGSNNLKLDTSCYTGQLDAVQINENNPILLTNTVIVSGEGLMLSVVVGKDTQWTGLVHTIELSGNYFVQYTNY